MIEEVDLDELVNQVAKRIIARQNATGERWIDAKDAMKLLGIKSTTTLQKYRDEHRIRFLKRSKKIIKYDRLSIEGYLDKNA